MAAKPKPSSGPSLALWLALAVLVILLDQLTKILIIGTFRLGDTQPVWSFFNPVRLHNTGAAFSFHTKRHRAPRTRQR
jgi:signal peptidase II